MSTQPTYDCSHMYNPDRFDSEAGRAARLRILAISESQQRFERVLNQRDNLEKPFKEMFR